MVNLMTKLQRAELFIAWLRETPGRYWIGERTSLIAMLEDYIRLLKRTGETQVTWPVGSPEA